MSNQVDFFDNHKATDLMSTIGLYMHSAMVQFFTQKKIFQNIKCWSMSNGIYNISNIEKSDNNNILIKLQEPIKTAYNENVDIYLSNIKTCEKTTLTNKDLSQTGYSFYFNNQVKYPHLARVKVKITINNEDLFFDANVEDNYHKNGFKSIITIDGLYQDYDNLEVNIYCLSNLNLCYNNISYTQYKRKHLLGFHYTPEARIIDNNTIEINANFSKFIDISDAVVYIPKKTENPFSVAQSMSEQNFRHLIKENQFLCSVEAGSSSNLKLENVNGDFITSSSNIDIKYTETIQYNVYFSQKFVQELDPFISISEFTVSLYTYLAYIIQGLGTSGLTNNSGRSTKNKYLPIEYSEIPLRVTINPNIVRSATLPKANESTYIVYSCELGIEYQISSEPIYYSNTPKQFLLNVGGDINYQTVID
jgi:hypothetical protein